MYVLRAKTQISMHIRIVWVWLKSALCALEIAKVSQIHYAHSKDNWQNNARMRRLGAHIICSN